MKNEVESSKEYGLNQILQELNMLTLKFERMTFNLKLQKVREKEQFVSTNSSASIQSIYSILKMLLVFATGVVQVYFVLTYFNKSMEAISKHPFSRLPI